MGHAPIPNLPDGFKTPNSNSCPKTEADGDAVSAPVTGRGTQYTLKGSKTAQTAHKRLKGVQ